MGDDAGVARNVEIGRFVLIALALYEVSLRIYAGWPLDFVPGKREFELGQMLAL